MSKPNVNIFFAAALISLGSSQISFAQTSGENPVIENSAPAQAAPTIRIKRDTQPIAYWVESSSLNMRDNPVAGKIVGNLEYGRKVLAYSQYENWIRVSKLDAKEQWVNSDFLSNSSLSWASYGRSKPTHKSDINPVRIKDPEDRKKRIYGVRLKKSDTGNALITTQQHTERGAFFQKRFVSCKNNTTVGVRLIGEGSNFLRAQNDIRNLGMDIYEPEQIEAEANNSAEAAIASFACKSRAF